MSFLLSISPDEYGSPIISSKGFMETVLFGGQMVLIGMLTVFSVLLVIWAALSIFKIVFSKKQKAEDVKPPIEPVVYTTPDNDDSEIIAVISAAIAAAESESSGLKFRVVSFKRK